MGLRKPGRSILPDEGKARRRGESWPAMLRRWLVECPRCAEVWLIVGVRENDTHVCKDCGHSFVVRLPRAPEDGRTRPAGRRESVTES